MPTPSPLSSASLTRALPRHENQARGLAQYALDFVFGNLPPTAVLSRLERFHLDSVACGVSALALQTRAPGLLRAEALENPLPSAGRGATCFGSTVPVRLEKAVAANCAAVREWDSNGTNFGYDPARGNTAGEFGHNDFYPVAIAAAQQAGLDGRQTVLGMLAIDEIRGRLAEVYSLKTHKIDHVVHGAIASAAVCGAMLGATVDQIESAIGLFVAHYVPFRAIRAGKQLSDSKGASAALSAEAAVLCVQRGMRGFVGPADIFRNPEALFCLFEPPPRKGDSPFDLTLATGGDDFAVMGMHFKLGLYEHQSAGAIQAIIDLLIAHPALLDDPTQLRSLSVVIYEPAFSIIADPAKRDPRTRQSADHSLPYIVARVLAKAFRSRQAGWEPLMLMPEDYDDAALADQLTRQLIAKIEIRHGGAEYDAKYPDGIPTSVMIEHTTHGRLESGLVMYPAGHARNYSADLPHLLDVKFNRLAALGTADVDALRSRMSHLAGKSAGEIADLYDFSIA
ncbi:MAG: MmgE/PrpD family protein [Planctomycetes bacterium]|nr:MmgE/PrpD family protein [Planctomycetota bacterium]